MALTVNNLFEHEARKRIEEEIARHMESLASGALADWGAYQKTAGLIAGLRQALECCDAAHDEIMKR